MSDAYGALAIDRVVPLCDDLYYDYLTRAIERARFRIWAAVFIVNPTRGQDPELKVRGLLDSLGAKTAMGLDVRVIVGVSDSTEDIQLTNEVALGYLQELGVPARPYRAAKHSMHAKYVIVDERLCMIGSHNWSHNAFTSNVEDSLAIESAEHAHLLARRFLTLWVD